MNDTANVPTPQGKFPSMSRRGIIQAGAALLAAPIVLSSLPKLGMAAATGGSTAASPSLTGKDSAGLPLITKKRTLGRGQFALEVSALGFGVMGGNYNRGVHPPEKDMTYLIGQAVEHGVTLFDTAQIYGPLKNEMLAGKALAPYKGKIAVTTKFGHKITNGVYETGKLDSTPANIRSRERQVCGGSMARITVEDCQQRVGNR